MTNQTGMSFITTMTKLKPLRNGFEARDRRCVGYLPDEGRAIDAVKANAFDLNEAGYYPLCVVETLGQGIYPDTLSIHWFEWDREEERYMEISGPPEDLKRQVCFSLG